MVSVWFEYQVISIEQNIVVLLLTSDAGQFYKELINRHECHTKLTEMKSITHGLVFGWVSMGRPTTCDTIAALKKNKIENVIWTMLIKSCMRAINAVRRRRSTQKITGNSILWIVVGGECRNQPNKERWSSWVFIRNFRTQKRHTGTHAVAEPLRVPLSLGDF